MLVCVWEESRLVERSFVGTKVQVTTDYVHTLQGRQREEEILKKCWIVIIWTMDANQIQFMH